MKPGKITRNFINRTQIETKTHIEHITQLQTRYNQKREEKGNETSIKRLIDDTSYYAELSLKRRGRDTNAVNVFYDLLDSKFDTICFNQCAKEAIITENVIKDISNVFPILKTYPELVLDLSSLFPDPNNKIKEVIDSTRLWQPDIKLVLTAYTFDPINSQIQDAKYKYLVNMEGRQIRQYLDNRHETVPNVKTNSELFLQFSNQSRWNNLWVQISNAFIFYDTTSQAKALQNLGLKFPSHRRKATELITLQSIAYILKKFTVLPFTVRKDGKLDISYFEQHWATCLIPLLYSLLELSKEEKGHNVNSEFIENMVSYRVRMAYNSFESDTLRFKSIYSAMIKLVTVKMNKYARRTYSQDMQIQRIRTYEHNVELLTKPSEITELLLDVKNKCDPQFLVTFNKYLDLLNSGTHTQNTERARWLQNILLIMGNTGLYYKTSLVLEKEEAVASKTLGTLDFPKPSKMWIFNDIKIDMETDWSTGHPIYKNIAERYKLAIEAYLPTLNTDLQEWFYMMLTNKSQGFKVDIDKFVSSLDLDPELLKALNSVSQVRVASFLINNEVFTIFQDFFEELQKNGVCTIRFSNNRKSRIIEIVPNADQIAYALVLKIFEMLKTDSEDIAVGKQVGGILDMSLQLRITGLDHGVSIFSDVAGMDAHTQPNVAIMFLKLLAEVATKNNLGPTNYFPFKTSFCVTEQVFDPTDKRLYGEYVTGINQSYQQELIPAISQALLFVASQRLGKKYQLKDNIFNCIIDINPSIFESGRFDTSAQHSTLLKFLSDIVYDSILPHMPEAAGKYLYQKRKFGDDSYESLEINGMTSLEKEKLISHIISETERVLYAVGLHADTELSAYYGDFLQQSALCGVAVPKSARSTIFTDESSALVNRDMIDLITNITNIITASAQRTYAPENVISIIRNIWATNRTFRILSSKTVLVDNKLKPYIKHFGGNAYLEYPYIMISLPPLNFPNQTFEFSNGLILPATSQVRTVGFCKLNYVWNETIPINIRKQLSTVDTDLRGRTKTINPVDVFIDNLKGTHIIESLLFATYNRSQQLSKNRFEKLKIPIMEMGLVAKNYFNQEKLKMSAAAAAALHSTYGITIPDALLYYMKPIEQLKNMFETRGETSDEAIGLNDEYINFINSSFKKLPLPIVNMIINTCIFWIDGTEKLEITYSEFPELPLFPSYNIDSDHYRAQLLVGNPFMNSQRHNKALITFSSRYGNAYNLEAIHRIGMKTLAIDTSDTRKAFYLFLDAMQLPFHIRQAVEELFSVETAIILPDVYSSGFQPEQNFAISDSINQVREYIQFRNLDSKPGRETLTVVLRDYLFLTAHRNFAKNKRTPVLPPVTFIRFNMRSLLASVGIKSK